MAAGLGTVRDPGTLLVGQRHLLHIAEIARAARMAALAPARAIAWTVVVIHRLDREAGRACVAGIAAHAGAGKQLGLVGDVVVRRGQARAAWGMTGFARPRGYASVAKHAIGESAVTGVAGVARGRGREVVARFAEGVPGGVGAVVARRALAGHDPLC